MMTWFDADTPSVARVHDALLGGCDNYGADRKQAVALTRIYPGLCGAQGAQDHGCYLPEGQPY